jgi:hypothetical protein
MFSKLNTELDKYKQNKETNINKDSVSYQIGEDLLTIEG